MKTAHMRLMRLLTTTVTLCFLWLVTKQGRVLEMATALLVLLIDYLQLVNVSVYFCFENLKTPSHLQIPCSHNMPRSAIPEQRQY